MERRDEGGMEQTKRIIKDITIQDIWEARKRISHIVTKTPLIKSTILSNILGRNVYLKLENVHEIGAFKVRGAANKILILTDEEKKQGVTTYSTGNHGMAVAYVAKKFGIQSVICISNRVPKVKVENLRRMGAHIEIGGNSQDDASERCYQLQKKQGLTVIDPFDDPYVIAGQGTIGLEILEEVPNVTNVVVPLSGGGLLSGIGLALKSIDSTIKITGTCMNHSAVMYESLKAGKPITLNEQDTLADSLLGGIGLDNQYTFRMVQKYMDDIALISEDEIAYSMGFMLDYHRMVVEGAAATGVAAVLRKQNIDGNGDIVIIISGNNVDLSVLLEVSKKYVDNSEKF